MGSSAFEVLVVPVFSATFGAVLAGVAIRVMINAVAALAGGMARSFKTVPGAVRKSRRRPVARGV